LVFALVVAAGGCAGTLGGSGDSWVGRRAPAPSDIVLEAGFLAATAIDWCQSGRFPRTCREDNPVIGRCGERVPLDVYIPISAAAHVALTYLLPRGTWRTAWLGLTVGMEVDVVYGNTLLP
jgi:hypothetical protein